MKRVIYDSKTGKIVRVINKATIAENLHAGEKVLKTDAPDHQMGLYHVVDGKLVPNDYYVVSHKGEVLQQNGKIPAQRGNSLVITVEMFDGVTNKPSIVNETIKAELYTFEGFSEAEAPIGAFGGDLKEGSVTLSIDLPDEVELYYLYVANLAVLVMVV